MVSIAFDVDGGEFEGQDEARDLTDEEVSRLTKRQQIERCMNCKEF